MFEKAESLFHKLEEKIVTLLTERDSLIQERERLIAENQELKAEKENSSQKLQELVLLIESVNAPKAASVAATAPAPAPTAENFSPSLAAIKPLIAQGQV